MSCPGNTSHSLKCRSRYLVVLGHPMPLQILSEDDVQQLEAFAISR
jgi:hypothetical protein